MDINDVPSFPTHDLRTQSLWRSKVVAQLLVDRGGEVERERERERERVAHRETVLYKFMVSICSFRSCHPLCVVVHHTEWQWQTHLSLEQAGWLK